MKPRTPKTLVSTVACVTCFGVLANPTGPQIANGVVRFERPNPTTLNVTNTPGAIINWNGFSIGANEATRFIQQHSASAVLNRVSGANPSQILGQLLSNGQVFLINRNGMVFGAGSRIDTAGFVASTLGLSDADFLAKNFRFEGEATTGTIANQGFIKSAPGGDVILIAPTVTNTGIIQTDGGDLILAAGQKVTLSSLDLDHISFEVQAAEHKALNLGKLVADQGAVGVFAGQIDQRGHIEANKVVRDARGVVRLVADTTVEVAGSVEAVGSNGASGGTVEILGQNVVVHDARINVSGDAGGGTVLVGGAFQGRGSTPTSKTTQVRNTTTIHADATGLGSGGQIIVWADESTQAHGQLTARGGPLGGDGGLIETSGKRFLDFSQAADVSAPKGKAGTWLLDPEDINIGGGRASAIEKTLNKGGNVSVVTSDSGTGEGNITVSASITKTDGGDASLSMKAHNRIDVNAPISSEHNKLNVKLTAGARVNINSGIDTNGGSLSTRVTGVMPKPPSPVEKKELDNETGTAQPGSHSAEDQVDESNDQPTGNTVEDRSDTFGQNPTESHTKAPEPGKVPATDDNAKHEVDEAARDNPSDTPTARRDTSDDANQGESPERGSNSPATSETPSEQPTEEPTLRVDEPAVRLADDTTSESTEFAAAEASDETVKQTVTAAQNLPVYTYEPADEPQPSITILDPVVTSGGDIRIDAGDSGTVSVYSAVDASDLATGGVGGDIELLGKQVGVFETANVDASGDAGGGTITIGGDLQGTADTPSASATYVGPKASVRADAVTSGDGGTVSVQSTESTKVVGELSARGGRTAGDGGFVMTSGGKSLQIKRAPDISAPAGDGGEWLIRSNDITLISETPAAVALDFTAITPAAGGWDSTNQDPLTPNPRTGDIGSFANIAYRFSEGGLKRTLTATATDDAMRQDYFVHLDNNPANAGMGVCTTGTSCSRDDSVNPGEVLKWSFDGPVEIGTLTVTDGSHRSFEGDFQLQVDQSGIWLNSRSSTADNDGQFDFSGVGPATELWIRPDPSSRGDRTFYINKVDGAGDPFDVTRSGTEVGWDIIRSAMAGGVTVTVEATPMGSENGYGNITVRDQFDYTASLDTNTLSLIAENDIQLESSILALSAGQPNSGLDLNFQSDSDGNGQGSTRIDTEYKERNVIIDAGHGDIRVTGGGLDIISSDGYTAGIQTRGNIAIDVTGPVNVINIANEPDGFHDRSGGSFLTRLAGGSGKQPQTIAADRIVVQATNGDAVIDDRTHLGQTITINRTNADDPGLIVEAKGVG
ncbi:MAG: filamentous hemagglutinin N-terminal domain-containing protein, partial [Gammaproteobacteria bacterium]|nr:filamentous hemagglutinin N-terminal domain-containing protein [Gammaproteobacteria bacterium]